MYNYFNKSVIIVLVNSLYIIIVNKFIASIVYSYVEKPVLCVFLECFKCEINKFLSIPNGLVLSHLSTPDLLKFGILLPPSSIVH